MNDKKGFSFIEIMIFCFISVILLTLIMGMFSNSREFSRTMGCINNMKNITQAIDQYHADWKETPVYLAALYPQYITSRRVFKCPADRETDDSYSSFYIGRDIAEKDANKIFLACHRHQKKHKTVAAYLSYAVDVSKSQPVSWSGIPAEFGKIYTGGTLTFADGTQVEIESGEAGVLSSFTGNDEKIYSVIYVPEETSTTLEIIHNGDSRFEVITPAVIAGVEGTRFTVATVWDTSSVSSSTQIQVAEGIVNVQERAFGRDIDIGGEGTGTPQRIKVTSRIWDSRIWDSLPEWLKKMIQEHPGWRRFVSRRPPRQQPQITIF